ncbi:hypothetical protein P3S67_002501 [Capsicum chacoense]
MAEIGKPNLVDYFPILGKIDLQGIRGRTSIHFGKLSKFSDDLINERLEEKKRGYSERSDVLEALLNITEKDPRDMDHTRIKYMLLVLINAWAIGGDSTFWEDPLVFKPERFLSLELDIQGQNFEMISFGGGRRMCPGLPLALKMLSVMLGSLLNSFHWKLEEGIDPEELDMEEKFGITLAKARPLRAIPSPL